MTPNRILLILAVGVGLVVGTAAVAVLLSEEPEEPFRPERYILPQEPVTEVKVVPAGEAADLLNPEELVLGVVVNGEARAYPLSQLNAHPARKVVNDRLGGRAVAATWCDSCFNGVVFARELDGRELVLTVSGQLWKQSMIMHDLETRSLWSQHLGEAKLGVLQGRRLEVLPSVLADWKGWRARHPDGTVAVLEKAEPAFTRAQLEEPGRLVLGIASGKRARAWGLEHLNESPAVNDRWDGRPVVAVLDRDSGAARLYERTVEGQQLTFRAEDGRLTDAETGSVWEPLTGRAVAGPLAGRHLTPLPAMVSYRDAWERFHPRSE